MLGEGDIDELQKTTCEENESEEIDTSKINNISDEDDDEDEPIITKKKRTKRVIIDDSEDETEDTPTTSLKTTRNEDDDLGENTAGSVPAEVIETEDEVVSLDIGNKSDSDNDSGSDDDEPQMSGAPDSRLLIASDIFDAEMGSSDSDEGICENTENSDRENEAVDSDDEMSAALKKRLSKGATKKPARERPPRISRPSKQDVQDIHSETQRLVRESDVRLPYHQPEKKGLNDFLAKAKRKQESFQQIKSRGGIKKGVDVPLIGIDGDDKQKVTKLEKVPQNVTVNSVHLVDLAKSSSSDEKDNHNLQLCDNTATSDTLNEDELPDLMIASEKTKFTTASSDKTELALNEMDITSANEEMSVENTVCPEPHTASKEADKPQHDSGYLTTPAQSSEEENSGDSMATTPMKKGDDQDDSTATPLRSVSLNKTTLTPQLAGLGVSKQTPRLSGGAEDFIDLDQEAENATPKVAVGVEKLMERFIKHSSSHKSKQKGADIEISTVTKDQAESGKEELKLDKFVYHIEEKIAEDPDTHKPGAKLLKLKDTLKQKMHEKRVKARQERELLETLDNEEGYEDILDDDGELTDQTDTDGEEEPEEEDIIEELYGADEEEKESNPFLDNEAEDQEDEDEDMGNDIEDEDDDPESFRLQLGDDQPKDACKGFLTTAMDKHKTMDIAESDISNWINAEVNKRPFEQLNGECKSSDANETHGNHSEELSMSMEKENSFCGDSSLDLVGSLIPAGQGNRYKLNGRDGAATPDIFTPSSKSSSLFKSNSNLTEFGLPVEDTQDLLNTDLPDTHSESTPRIDYSQSFNFSIDDDTSSQLLDEDGLLKVDSVKKPSRRQLMMDDDSENVDDLLALCSGKFTETQSDNKPESTQDELMGLCSGKFVATQDTEDMPNKENNEKASGDAESSQDMRELIGLCSGKFTSATQSAKDGGSEPNSPVNIARKKRTRAVIDDESSNDSFDIASDGGNESENCEGLDSDEEVQGVEEEDEEEVQRKAIKTMFSKKGKLRTEFVDDEAQLSSDDEPDSDEDWDLDDKDDVLEKEAGDDDRLNEDDLRNQVGRVHLKTMIDDDAKEIRLMKEMYLPDGDLHEDGAGRQRKFRWKNVEDDDTQQDLFDNSDHEGDGEENEEEAAWRKQRYERERFLEEQKATQAEEAPCDQIKLGKSKIQFSKGSSSTSVKSVTESCSRLKGKVMGPPAPPSPNTGNIFHRTRQSHGSFLTRSKAQLAKIAEMAKPAAAVGGPRNSRSFVFQTMTADEKEKQTNKNAQVKRTTSVDGSKQPPKKRPKLERSNTLPANSIFNLF